MDKIIQILKKTPEFRDEEEMKFLIPILSDIAFFKEKKIKPKDLGNICQRLKYEYHEQGKNVITVNEYGDKFYIILQGLVSVWIPERRLTGGNTLVNGLESNVSPQQLNKQKTLIKKQTIKNINQKPPSNLEILTASYDKSNESLTLQSMNTKQLASRQQLIKLNDNSYSSLNQRSKQSLTLNDDDLDQQTDSIDISENLDVQQDLNQQMLLMRQSTEGGERRFREVTQLGNGKSFGELALIVHKPRMATIKCEVGTHFAVLEKQDFQKSLLKIEKKYLNKMIDFLKNTSCFQKWTRNSIGRFSYFLSKEKYNRSQYVYKENQKAEKVYIVKKGEFELQKKMPNNLSDTASQVIQLMGKKMKNENILRMKMPEIKDIPGNMKLSFYGIGSLIGEEDTLNRDKYSCSLRCYTQKGTVYAIKKQDFMLLRNQDDSWLNILEKVILKESRRNGDFINKHETNKLTESYIQPQQQQQKQQTNQQLIQEYQYYKDNNERIPVSFLLKRTQQGDDQNNNEIQLSHLIHLQKKQPDKMMNISKLLSMSNYQQQFNSNRVNDEQINITDPGKIEYIAVKDLNQQLRNQTPQLYKTKQYNNNTPIQNKNYHFLSNNSVLKYKSSSLNNTFTSQFIQQQYKRRSTLLGQGQLSFEQAFYQENNKKQLMSQSSLQNYLSSTQCSGFTRQRTATSNQRINNTNYRPATTTNKHMQIQRDMFCMTSQGMRRQQINQSLISSSGSNFGIGNSRNLIQQHYSQGDNRPQTTQNIGKR